MTALLDTTVQIAREAGALVLPYFQRGVRVEYKGEVDVVTEADRASEQFILKRLAEHFPDHAVTGEETGRHAGSSGYRWYVDPVDGTTNFAHGFPVFCISMGLEKNGELVLGVIYDPIRDELFCAEKGSGATLNGEKLSVSRVSRLEEALVATGFPSKKRHQNINIHFYHQLSMHSHGVRRAGSAALDLAYVAAGRLDCFWEFNLHSWDVAAGKIIVQEAGGCVSEMTGSPHALQSPTIAASNCLLHQEMLGIFQEVFNGLYRAPLPKPELTSE